MTNVPLTLAPVAAVAAVSAHRNVNYVLLHRRHPRLGLWECRKGVKRRQLGSG